MNHREVTIRARETRKLLRLHQVQDLTGLARSTIYKLISDKRFPAGISLSGRSVAWDSHAIEAWIESRISASA